MYQEKRGAKTKCVPQGEGPRVRNEEPRGVPNHQKKKKAGISTRPTKNHRRRKNTVGRGLDIYGGTKKTTEKNGRNAKIPLVPRGGEEGNQKETERTSVRAKTTNLTSQGVGGAV